MRLKSENVMKPKVPSPHNWKTTDEDDIARRRLRARAEYRSRQEPRCTLSDLLQLLRQVGEWSDLFGRNPQRLAAAILMQLRRLPHQWPGDLQTRGGRARPLFEARHARLFRHAQHSGPPRIDIVPDHSAGVLRIEAADGGLPPSTRHLVDSEGRLTADSSNSPATPRWLPHTTIDFTPVSCADNKYYQQIIFDLVDDSVVADPDAKNPVPALDGLRCRRTRIRPQALNPLLNPPLIGFGKVIQLAICGGRKSNLIHQGFIPSSFLTRSQGIGFVRPDSISARIFSASSKSIRSSIFSISAKSSTGTSAATSLPRR